MSDIIAPVTYDDLTAEFGGCTAAARAIERSKQTVHKWRASGIPDVEQLRIQKLFPTRLKADPKIVKKYRDLLRVAA